MPSPKDHAVCEGCKDFDLDTNHNCRADSSFCVDGTECPDFIGEGNCGCKQCLPVEEEGEPTKGFMDALIDYCQDYYKHYDGYPVDFEYKDKVYPYEYYARYLPPSLRGENASSEGWNYPREEGRDGI